MFKRICWMLKRLTKLQSFTSLMQKRCILFSMITRILCREQLVLTYTTLPGCSQYPQAASPPYHSEKVWGVCLLPKPNTCERGRRVCYRCRLHYSACWFSSWNKIISVWTCVSVLFLEFIYLFIHLFLPMALEMFHIYAWEIKKSKKRLWRNIADLTQHSPRWEWWVLYSSLNSSWSFRNMSLLFLTKGYVTLGFTTYRSGNIAEAICVQESLFCGWVSDHFWFFPTSVPHF